MLFGFALYHAKSVGMLFAFLVYKESFEMKATKRIIAGISIATVVGLVVYMFARRRKTKLMDEQVSEHGY
ncbi:MAG: hypothetical protein ABIR18_06945, partial [Chitinophagaceae bacterium]